jgi:glycosyltransferase involved in cell wall biosynthesis
MSQIKKEKISVVIPVFNESKSIAKVLDAIPTSLIHEVVVVDNGSTDGSDKIAIKHGATVIKELERGYGAACLKGIAYLKDSGSPEILVFLDGDYSDYPEDMIQLIEKIEEGYDFVLGSRILGVETGIAKLSSHSILGNKLAGFFLRWLFGGNYTDLGPFRAIKFNKLLQLKMADRNYGWTMEMQIKAARQNLNTIEIPIRYRERFGGVSKVTGTFKGSVKAFTKITLIVMQYFFRIKK